MPPHPYSQIRTIEIILQHTIRHKSNQRNGISVPNQSQSTVHTLAINSEGTPGNEKDSCLNLGRGQRMTLFEISENF